MADIISTKIRASFDVDVDIILDLCNSQINVIVNIKEHHIVLFDFGLSTNVMY